MMSTTLTKPTLLTENQSVPAAISSQGFTDMEVSFDTKFVQSVKKCYDSDVTLKPSMTEFHYILPAVTKLDTFKGNNSNTLDIGEITESLTSIELVNFPLSRYTLVINGINSLSSNNNKFDFTETQNNKIEGFKRLSHEALEATPGIEGCVTCKKNNTPFFTPEKDCLHFSKLDSVVIKSPKGVKLPESCELKLKGYKDVTIDHNLQIETSWVLNLIPNDIYTINLINTVASYMVLPCYPNKYLKLTMEGHVLADIKFNDYCDKNFIILKLHDHEGKYPGAMNYHVDMKYGLNLSRIGSMRVHTDMILSELPIYAGHYDILCQPNIMVDFHRIMPAFAS